MGRKRMSAGVRVVVVQIPIDLGAWLEDEARKKNTSMKQIIVSALELLKGKGAPRVSNVSTASFVRPEPKPQTLDDRFKEIYGYCGGEDKHAWIAEKLGTTPERLQEYLDGTMEVTQAHIDRLTEKVWSLPPEL